MCQLNVMYNLLTCIFLIKNYLGCARNVIYKLDCTAIMILNQFSCRYCAFVYCVRFYICWRTYSNNSRKCMYGKKENGYRRNYFAHTHLQKPHMSHRWEYIITCICSIRSLFTARKRSLRRLCFYMCLSVILITGGCAWPGGHAWLRGAYMAGGACMARGRVCHACPLPRLILWDTVGQWAGGTHPTGMHSCF